MKNLFGLLTILLFITASAIAQEPGQATLDLLHEMADSLEAKIEGEITMELAIDQVPHNPIWTTGIHVRNIDTKEITIIFSYMFQGDVAATRSLTLEPGCDTSFGIAEHDIGLVALGNGHDYMLEIFGDGMFSVQAFLLDTNGKPHRSLKIREVTTQGPS